MNTTDDHQSGQPFGLASTEGLGAWSWTAQASALPAILRVTMRGPLADVLVRAQGQQYAALVTIPRREAIALADWIDRETRAEPIVSGAPTGPYEPAFKPGVRDWCTDPDNCARCKAPAWDQHRNSHAGIPLGTQRRAQA